jgi:two-component system OmpR family response regulator
MILFKVILGVARDFRMRILLIEDDADVAGLVISGLQEAGHKVSHAADGEAGMKLALAGPFEVMIFDRQLPGGVDSADLAQDLRERGVKTPVLFLSGLGGLQDWIRGLDVGGDDYIVKPFVFEELRARVEALQQKQEAKVA